MSLGLFGAVLAVVLVVLCLDRANRLRTVVTGLAGIMLGLVIAGSNGVLVEPAHKLVDGVRAGLTAVAEQIGGDEKPGTGDKSQLGSSLPGDDGAPAVERAAK
jgi:hypothetical protein